jgi:hypothetical protein
MILKFQVATVCFLCSPPDINSSNYFSKLYNSLFQWIKIRQPPSQANICNHGNAFTFIIPLSEGRAGEAWEPNKVMLPSSVHWIVFHFSRDFSLSSTLLLQFLPVSLLAHRSPRFWAGTDNSFVHNIACEHIPRHINPWWWRQTISGSLTRLISREDFIVYCRHESLKSCI